MSAKLILYIQSALFEPVLIAILVHKIFKNNRGKNRWESEESVERLKERSKLTDGASDEKGRMGMAEEGRRSLVIETRDAYHC